MLPKGLGRHLGARFPNATASCCLHQSKWNPPQVQAPPLCPIQKPISEEPGPFQVHRGVCLHLTWLFTKCVHTSLGGPCCFSEPPPAYLQLRWGSKLASLLGSGAHAIAVTWLGLGLWAEGGNFGALLRAEGSRHTQKRQLTFA